MLILPPLVSKLINATRDMTAANGAVSYTGVGFKPKAIIIVAALDSNVPHCQGFVDSAGGAGRCLLVAASGNAYLSLAELIDITTSFAPDTAQRAVFTSFDDDGFTLTWTKTGVPGAGTFNIVAYCLA